MLGQHVLPFRVIVRFTPVGVFPGYFGYQRRR